jgi:predicted lipid carrier protein YhbT
VLKEALVQRELEHKERRVRQELEHKDLPVQLVLKEQREHRVVPEQ